MKDLYAKTIPALERFQTAIEEMSVEQVQQKNILANFDMIMLEKASKFSVIDLEIASRKSYLEKHLHQALEKELKEKLL